MPAHSAPVPAFRVHPGHGVPGLPESLLYREEFLGPADERQLLARIREFEFQAVVMHGVTARRRVLHYGWNYRYDSWRITEGSPIPEFLEPVRQRAATFAGVAPGEFAEVLITEYPPGATIGWHRDAPMFGIVAGISLLASCRMRFRRGAAGAWETTELLLEPRSAYLLRGAARSEWQHSIPAVKALRYSITFRTLRRGKRAGRPPRSPEPE